MSSMLSNNYGAFDRETETVAIGGAIYNSGTLSIINSTLSNNHADEGAAISNDGTLTIINSTLCNNNGSYAISNHGTLTIINSTLFDNIAGIFNWGTVNIINSTLSGNGPAIYTNDGGVLNISFSTIVHNGTGIHSFGERKPCWINLKNSILANIGPNYSKSELWEFKAFGVNFSTDDTCPGFIQVSLDELKLGPLVLNTPGTTKTHALLPGSVAIGTVADCTDLAGNVISADQRGASRPLRDAGSYEFYPTPTRGVPLF